MGFYHISPFPVNLGSLPLLYLNRLTLIGGSIELFSPAFKSHEAFQTTFILTPSIIANPPCIKRLPRWDPPLQVGNGNFPSART
jgi:hypothetical protein